MECGYQLFIIVLDCLFLKLILANYAPLNYNSTEDKEFFFPIPCSALDILRFQILSIVFQLLRCVLLFPPHGLQHTRLPCPSPSPRVCWNSCPLSQWCSLTMLSITILFSFCLQSFPVIRVFSNKSDLRIRWPKYQSFSFNISPSDEYSGLISFRID